MSERLRQGRKKKTKANRQKKRKQTNKQTKQTNKQKKIDKRDKTSFPLWRTDSGCYKRFHRILELI